MELIIKEVEKSFESKEVLKKASFTFERGKIYGLLGRNGAGKTTLFNCIANDLRYEAGNILLKDENKTRELTSEDIGYVYATPVLPEFLTGYEFIKFYMDINQGKIQSTKSIEDYFELVSIAREDQHKLIRGYSHGMKNKLQMMLFLITKPTVVLMDEPLTSLDVVVALEMKHLLREMKEDHIIIFSTHILQLATDLCDEIAILNDGKMEQLDHSMLKDPDFENKLVQILSEGEPANA